MKFHGKALLAFLLVWRFFVESVSILRERRKDVSIRERNEFT